MNTEKEFIPQLRFPEYTHANSFWHEIFVGDSIKTIAPPKKLQSNDYKETGKYPIIDQSQEFICGYSDDDSALINKNSRELIVFGDHTCVLKFIDFPFIQGADGIKIFEPQRADEIDVGYLYQYLVSSHIESKEYKRHFSELKEKIFLYPTINEQTKIADCLFAIDSYISSINEKVEQLKAHKKSLMQKMFPQKGQTVPEYRLPEFKDSKGWEEKRLGDIFKRITNKNITNNQNVLTISAQYGLVSQYDYFHKSVAASDLSNYYLLKKGDFAYNKSRSQGYPYGAIKPLRLYDEGVVSTLYICFRIKGCDIVDTFFEYYFETELINEEIGKIAQEGARNHGLLNISTDDFFNKVVLLVPSPSEQKVIAECLSSLDRTIRLYSEKVSRLEQHKKGLMQQLFPKVKKLKK